MTYHALVYGFCDRCGGSIAAGDPTDIAAEGVVCLDCAKAAEK